jgi:threonine dehydrogenase-like Zn-dependent dehydrogenase
LPQRRESSTSRSERSWRSSPQNKMGHEFLGVIDEQGYFKLFVKKMK